MQDTFLIPMFLLSVCISFSVFSDIWILTSSGKETLNLSLLIFILYPEAEVSQKMITLLLKISNGEIFFEKELRILLDQIAIIHLFIYFYVKYYIK